MSSTIYLILGQTATGKTARAVALAREVQGELVNCDSRQIYKELNIITGKTDNPTDVPAHLIDIVSPNEPFSAYDFAQQGLVAIQEIVARGKVPIVVGGTGNYARMLLYIDSTKVHDAPSSLRGAINTKKPRKAGSTLLYSDSVGNSIGTISCNKWDCHVVPPKVELLAMTNKRELQQRLIQLDDNIYNQLNASDKENPRRLMRAIQRLENETSELLDLDSPHTLSNQYIVETTILMHKGQETLQTRISRRVEERLRLGAVEECRSLLEKGYKPTDFGLATIGYQSIFRYLAGVIDFETMKTEWITKERQYAKRQKTYLLKYFPQAEIIRV